MISIPIGERLPIKRAFKVTSIAPGVEAVEVNSRCTRDTLAKSS